MIENKSSPGEIESYTCLYGDQLNNEDESYNGKFTHFDSHNESIIEVA